MSTIDPSTGLPKAYIDQKVESAGALGSAKRASSPVSHEADARECFRSQPVWRPVEVTGEVTGWAYNSAAAEHHQALAADGIGFSPMSINAGSSFVSRRGLL